jgi:hypothetical protein
MILAQSGLFPDAFTHALNVPAVVISKLLLSATNTSCVFALNLNAFPNPVFPATDEAPLTVPPLPFAVESAAIVPPVSSNFQ